mmetsp:Transcript_17622/g.35400  ORF Transcript_17622/g.35400 Transcript_17622/m.35400 type:complete len:162 (+) Transcript_17622:84-569(+)
MNRNNSRNGEGHSNWRSNRTDRDRPPQHHDYLNRAPHQGYFDRPPQHQGHLGRPPQHRDGGDSSRPGRDRGSGTMPRSPRSPARGQDHRRGSNDTATASEKEKLLKLKKKHAHKKQQFQCLRGGTRKKSTEMQQNQIQRDHGHVLCRVAGDGKKWKRKANK